MPSRAILVLVAFALTSAVQAAAALPNVERSAVVTGQGYFPVAIRLQDGRIAAVLRGGAPHIGIKGRLDVVFSADEGKTWSKPTVVIDSDLDDRNPAFGQAKDGTLVVGYWHCANYDEQGRYQSELHALGKSRTKVVRSPDGGKTWSKPADIDVSDLGYGSPYGKIVTMPDGAMLMPVYGTGVHDASGKLPAGEFSYLYRSTDDGKTWSRFSTVGATRFNETGIVRLKSGELLAAMRTVEPVQDVWITRSKDGGKTWDEPRQVTQKLMHPADLVQLPDGRVLLAAGNRQQPFGVVAFVGDVNELEWSDIYTLYNGATSLDCGYPSSVVLKDGRVLTLYYAVGDKEHPNWGEHCGALVYQPPAPPK